MPSTRPCGPFSRSAKPSPWARAAACRPTRACPTWATLRQDLHTDVVQRYGRRLDSLDGPFLGDPARILTRVRVASRDRFVAALILDKDPGERFTWQPDQGAYGYDYVSAGVALRRFGRVDALVLGDYTATFGQGLVLGRTGAMGKGRETTRGVGRSGAGIALHGSSEENRFFRGAGASVQLIPGLSLTAFGSWRTLDATPCGRFALRHVPRHRRAPPDGLRAAPQGLSARADLRHRSAPAPGPPRRGRALRRRAVRPAPRRRHAHLRAFRLCGRRLPGHERVRALSRGFGAGIRRGRAQRQRGRLGHRRRAARAGTRGRTRARGAALRPGLPGAPRRGLRRTRRPGPQRARRLPRRPPPARRPPSRRRPT